MEPAQDEEAPAADPEPEPAATEAQNEAKKAMEAANAARLQRQKEDLAEYEEMRKEAKEKEAAEIAALREKRIQRQKEREEEEKRMAEYRAQEEVKRRAEEELRRKQKLEEEQRIKDEKERKKREAEERLKAPKGRNFKITKKSDSEKAEKGPVLDSIMSKEDMQKSKEQLEEEKQAILAQRIQPLVIDGLAADKLIEKAKELNEHIRRLEGDKYDLEQRFKRQQYDMIELAERARQMNKGKGKRATVQVDETGFDRLADKYTSAPPKIQLCSKYERHTDHRSYKQRIDLFEDLSKEVPAPGVGKAAEAAEEAGGEEVEAAAEEE